MAACPSCGAPHPERARFCAECGAALAAPSPREVRKVVTVLFADVTGSTALGERLDPEAVRKVMARYFETSRAAIQRHGGTVEKFIGDAVMAVFGIPAVHEDDALRAVRAADELSRALRTLDVELASSGVALGVRIGIETGEVVAGVGRPETTLVTGDAVNVAARLEQAAGPGEVLLGAGTLDLVRDAVVVESLAPLALKGKASPVAAFRLISVSAGVVGRTRRRDLPMVGREHELAVLRQALERAVADRSARRLTVFGSAGVGKSRLVREFLAGIGSSAIVVRGRCLPYGEGITYWPIAEIVRAGAGIDDDDSAEAARARLDRVFGDGPGAQLDALRIAGIVGLGGSPAEPDDLFAAVRGLLERLAANRPLVIVVEDVHWAEPTLLDLIDDLVARSHGFAILCVACARPDLIERRPGWADGAVQPSLVLENLPAEVGARLLAGLLPGAHLSDAIRMRLEEAAEGNPLFAEELVGMLVDDGLVRPEGGVWVATASLEAVRIPPTINALLGARLDRLAPDVRAVAERASVIGRVFDRATVIGVSPEPERETVPGHLATLVGTELVVPLDGGSTDPERFQFRHILIRDAAYAALPKASRADLHERLAGWIEQVSGDRLGEVEEIVGYHLEAAHQYHADLGTLGERGDEIAGRAARHLAVAALRAVARSDTPAAANLLTRTAALLPPDDPARGPLLVDLGLALREMGEPDRADAVLAEVMTRAEASGDASMRAHAIIQRWLAYDATHGRMAEAELEARAALVLFEASGDELGQARAWRLLSEVDWADGQGAAAEAANESDLVHARRSGRPREQTEAYCILSGILFTGPAPIADGIRLCEEILSSEAGNGAVEGWIWHALAHLRVRLGAFPEARELAAKSDAVLRKHGQSYESAIQSELFADVELVAGDPAAATIALREGLEITEHAGRPSLMLAAFLSRAAVEAGQPVVAEAAAEQAIDGGGWIRAIAQGVLGRIRGFQGRYAEADLLTREAVAYFEGTDFLTFHARACLDQADVLWRSGRREAAIEAATMARALHERKGSLVEAAQAERLLIELRAQLSLQTSR